MQRRRGVELDGAKTSVVIPAHNEATVIAQTLDSLLRGAERGELEVVVVCNGCTDGTAEVARRFGEAVTVIETPVPSKSAALNLGDAVATGFPRFYVDADVALPIEAVRAVRGVLQSNDAIAASPQLAVDLSASSWPVRAFYRLWLREPYHTVSHIGSGVYAVSREGRQRFGPFPPILADDEYVRRHFSDAERRTVPHVSFTIRAPHTLRELIKVKTRTRLSLYELQQRFPELGAKRLQAPTRPRLPRVGGRDLLDVAPYVLVKIVTRLRARRRLHALDRYVWERDESSRRTIAAAHEIDV